MTSCADATEQTKPRCQEVKRVSQAAACQPVWLERSPGICADASQCSGAIDPGAAHSRSRDQEHVNEGAACTNLARSPMTASLA